VDFIFLEGRDSRRSHKIGAIVGVHDTNVGVEVVFIVEVVVFLEVVMKVRLRFGVVEGKGSDSGSRSRGGFVVVEGWGVGSVVERGVVVVVVVVEGVVVKVVVKVVVVVVVVNLLVEGVMKLVLRLALELIMEGGGLEFIGGGKVKGSVELVVGLRRVGFHVVLRRVERGGFTEMRIFVWVWARLERVVKVLKMRRTRGSPGKINLRVHVHIIRVRRPQSSFVKEPKLGISMW